MDTQIVQKIEINDILLKKELDIISGFNFNDTYQEFICGSWKSCMLYNKSGYHDDTVVTNYISKAMKTPYVEQLPYINELINEIFNINLLRFVRLVILGPNSVVIPHRDYLELNQDFLRFHIPLQTNEHCFNSEENLVYQMRKGEVWYINATKVHSAGNFSSNIRLHLILDFDFRTSFKNILNSPSELSSLIPGINIIQRPLPIFSEDFTQSLLVLSKFIDIYTFYDVVSILVKQHFYKEIHAAELFDWLSLIAESIQDNQIKEKISWLKKYCIKQR